jgi:hypothetical protein
LDVNTAIASNILRKSLMRSPEAFFLMAPIAAGYRLAVPLMTWTAHLLMDYIQISFLGVMSGTEFFFLGALIIVLFWVELREIWSHAPGATVRDLLFWEAYRLDNWAGEQPILWRVSRRLGPRGSGT